MFSQGNSKFDMDDEGEVLICSRGGKFFFFFVEPCWEIAIDILFSIMFSRYR